MKSKKGLTHVARATGSGLFLFYEKLYFEDILTAIQCFLSEKFFEAQ